MLNVIWLALLVVSVVLAGFTGKLPQLTTGAFATAKDAVMEIALPLVGLMAIWLGIMKLAEQAGLVQLMARALRPILRRLFPDVPPDHPAMGSMLMNISANMFGLGNAATPLGLRAMNDLEKLNPRPGVATNAMCTFLAINTSSVQLVPTTAIAILAISGSRNPTAIVSTAFFATSIACISGVAMAKFLEKLRAFRLPPISEPAENSGMAISENADAENSVALEKIVVHPFSKKAKWLLAFFGFLFAAMFALLAFPDWINASLTAIHQHFAAFPAWKVSPLAKDMADKNALLRSLNAVSILAVPFLLSFFPLYAHLRGVKVYEQFTEGAKEAFEVAKRIIPFLVAMLVGIRMFKEAGGIDLISKLLRAPLTAIHFPVDLLPMVLMRPLSGSATLGIFTELVQRLGPDNPISLTAATIFGSTETTFYVLAVYFGAVAIRKTRHAVLAGLTADTVGVIASLVICHYMFG